MLRAQFLLSKTAVRSMRVASPAFIIRGGAHHEDHTMEPPFHRLPLPSKPLHEEDELMWNDGVAPETAIDFDAPHVSPRKALAFWLGGFAFFAGVYQFAKSLDPASKKLSAARDLPEEEIARALGK